MLSAKTSTDPKVSYVIVLSVKAGEQELLARSLGSLVRNSHPAAEIVLIQDETVGIRAADLAAYDGSRERGIVFGPVVPAGRSAVQRAIRLRREVYGSLDLLVLRCGIEVPLGWDERLQLVAHQDGRVGTLSPLCDHSSLFRLVSAVVAVDVDRVDGLLCGFGRGESSEVPTFLESCTYIKGDALDATDVDLTATGADAITLSRAVNASGYAHAVCDCLYVGYRGRDDSQTDLERAYSQDVDALIARHPLTGLRHSLNDALSQGMQWDPSWRRPAQLHVLHGWGGGLERWVRDFVAHDRSRKNYILKAVGNWGQFGQRLELYDSPDMERPIGVWALQFPIKALALVNLQYRRVLTEILNDYGIEVVLVSSLIGHSLDVLDLPVQTLVVFHDYLPFCPALNIYFDGVCDHCDDSRLGRCFAANELNCFFANVGASEWLDIRRRFQALVTERGLRIVVPTASVERHWKQLVPELSGAGFSRIPHGGSALNRIARVKRGPTAGKLRVLVLGSFAVQKGGRLLQESLPALLDVAEFLLLGCGEGGASLATYPGIEVVPHYRPEELERIAAGFDPDLGLLASIVPETFSYTLSELIGLGIPPMAPNRGSFADRIRHGETGILYEPEAEVLQREIRTLAADWASVDAVRDGLRSLSPWSVEEMVATYHALSQLPAFNPARCPRSMVPKTPVPLLSIDPGARFVDAYRAFGVYSQQKLRASPRFKSWQKRVLRRLLAYIFRLG